MEWSILARTDGEDLGKTPSQISPVFHSQVLHLSGMLLSGLQLTGSKTPGNSIYFSYLPKICYWVMYRLHIITSLITGCSLCPFWAAISQMSFLLSASPQWTVECGQPNFMDFSLQNQTSSNCTIHSGFLQATQEVTNSSKLVKEINM